MTAVGAKRPLQDCGVAEFLMDDDPGESARSTGSGVAPLVKRARVRKRVETA